MQTITTTYIGPTNTKPIRIKATHSGGKLSVTLPRDSYDTVAEAESAAVAKIMEKLGWHGKMIGGSLNSNKTVWVFARSTDSVVVA